MGFADEAFDELAGMMRGRSAMQEKLQHAGQGEPFVMRFLSMREVATPSQLAHALNSSTGRISAVLSQLEKKGFITRETDPSDRRNVLVRLTDAGRKQVEFFRDEMHRDVRQVFERMGEEHTRQFVALLKEFSEYMCEAAESKDRNDRGSEAS